MLLYDPTWCDTFPKAFDDLRFIEIVEGAGHWVQDGSSFCTLANGVVIQMIDCTEKGHSL
jgi:hypothetical protein